MSDKLTELTVLTSLQDSDLLYVVTDVATTPVSRAVEVDVLDARYAPIAGSLTRIGNGTVQYQVPVTGATPFTPVWSGFLLAGTSGGKTVFAVTDTKTLTLTSAGDYNLTVPATGTAALLGTANVFTQRQTITATADAALSDEYITATANRDFSATTDWTGTNWLRPLLAVAQANDVTVDAAGKTFTRTAGSFITDGFKVGMSVTWSGFVKAGTVNNNTFVITTLTNLVMTCSAATLSDEVPADYTACSATSAVFSHAVAGANAATLANDKLTAAPANGSIFQVTITAQTVVANTLTVSIGGVAMASVIGKVTGALTAYVFNIEATGAGVLTVTPGATWLGWIDDISVKLVTSAASLLDGKMLAGTTVLETRVPNSTSMGMGLNTLKGSVQTNCIAFGHNALQSNTGAYSNAFGYGALYQNTGEYSNAFGYGALYQNTGAYSNAFGHSALQSNTGAYSNAFGYVALYQNTGAYSNAFGHSALHQNTGAYSNAFGHSALQSNTGAYSNAFGYVALYQNTGAYSNAFGHSALHQNTGAYSNAFGHSALQSNTGAYSNAFGYVALYQNTGAYSNAFGYAALYQNTGAYSNAFGYAALQSNTGAYSNAFGDSALYDNQAGIGNAAFGHNSGRGYANNNYSIFLGYDASTAVGTLTNCIVIGANARGTKSNQVTLGHTDVVETVLRGNVGIGTTDPATKFHTLLSSAATNAVTNVVTIGHDTTGTAAAGFGAGQLFTLKSSTTAAQSAARIQALWYEATHATRKADLVGTAYDAGGERELWRGRANGSAPAIGFLGAAPSARKAHVADPTGGATVDAEARTAINSILATLEGFGLHATA